MYHRHVLANWNSCWPEIKKGTVYNLEKVLSNAIIRSGDFHDNILRCNYHFPMDKYFGRSIRLIIDHNSKENIILQNR